MNTVYFACCFVLLIASSNCMYDDKLFRSDYQYYAEADGWFKVHLMPVSWQDARLLCAYEGAILASPTTNGITGVMKSLVAEYKLTAVYSGIHATLFNGDFNSLDGIPLSDIPVTWKPSNPNNYIYIKNCIIYHAEGLVEGIDCRRPYPYICYKKYQDLNMTECGTTDTKYTLDTRTNKCYKFHWIGRTYNHASAVCSAEGGHLAIINSEVEAEVLRTIFAEDPKWQASYGDLVRLGFYNWDGSNFFGTLHGQTLEEAGYEKWLPGEPSFFSDATRQKCGGMFRNGLLDDTTCEQLMPFICEKNPDALRISGLKLRFGQ